jgi:hypothetical protein
VERCWFWSCAEELSAVENHPDRRCDDETTSPENRFRIVRALQPFDRGSVGIEGL